MTREELIDQNVYYQHNRLYWKTTNREHKEGEAVQGWFQEGYYRFSIKKVTLSFAQAVYYLHYRFLPKMLSFKDGDRTNYRIENLEPTSGKLERWKSKKLNPTTSSSIYKGVCSHGSGYRAYITKEGKRYHLGTFKTEHEAAKKYNQAALDLFGSYAHLNNIEVD